MPVTNENIDRVFTYQPPDDEQVAKYRNIRMKAQELAEVIIANTPSCADQQAAVRHVREAMMTANAAVALKGLV